MVCPWRLVRAGRSREGFTRGSKRDNLHRKRDHPIIKDIAKALNEIRKMKRITIVVSEQVLSFALDVADRLFVIEGGRLVHETTRADTDQQRIKSYLSV